MPAQSQPSLQHFPTFLFTSSMGVSTLSIAGFTLNEYYGLPLEIPIFIRFIAGILFFSLLVLQILKTIKHFDTIKEEISEPTLVCSYSTIAITVLLQAKSWSFTTSVAHQPLWWIGSILILLSAMRVFTIWIYNDTKLDNISPLWIIPMVGNMIVALLAKQITNIEVGWAFFSIGLILSMMVFTTVVFRVIASATLPEKIMPSLFVLISPLAVGTISYMELIDKVDPFARMLFYPAAFLWLLLLSQYRRFSKLPHTLTSWAYIFPSAALSIGAINIAYYLDSVYHLYFAYVVLLPTSIFSVFLLASTINQLINGKALSAP